MKKTRTVVIAFAMSMPLVVVANMARSLPVPSCVQASSGRIAVRKYRFWPDG
jgi:hypothetical protein